MISRVEFQEWRAHPTTQEFFKILGQIDKSIQDDWAARVFLGATAEETAQRNNFALGQIDMVRKILATDFIEEISENGE